MIRLDNHQIIPDSLKYKQREVKRLDPNEFVSGTGIAGRMADALSSDGSNFGLFSIDR